jgi:hypothetical protein
LQPTQELFYALMSTRPQTVVPRVPELSLSKLPTTPETPSSSSTVMIGKGVTWRSVRIALLVLLVALAVAEALAVALALVEAALLVAAASGDVVAMVEALEVAVEDSAAEQEDSAAEAVLMPMLALPMPAPTHQMHSPTMPRLAAKPALPSTFAT